MNSPQDVDRRTVLKTIGAGAIGGTVTAGSATAHGGGPALQRVWTDGFESEMLGTEPFNSPDGFQRDDEGDEEAHSPLYIIAPTRNKPQAPGHADFPICHDHVVTLEGTEFSAQWHVRLVVEPGTETFDGTQLVNEDGAGNCLKSASAVESAASAGEVDILPTEVVFTCPVRPLKGNHPLPSCPTGNVDPGSNC